ncbi:unnamed protein product [Penicillium palitans]
MDMGSSFDGTNHGLQVGHNTGTATHHTELVTGDTTTTTGGAISGASLHAGRDIRTARKRRAGDPNFEDSSSSSKHRDKRLRQDHDGDSSASEESEPRRDGSPRNVLESSQLASNSYDHASLLRSLVDRMSPSDLGISSSEESSESGLSDDGSSSSGDEETSDSFEEDSE